MEQFNDENNNITPPTMPIKRKRGRPRKDKSLKNLTKTIATLNSPPSMISVSDANSSLVGQPVTGVIEASFDDGFLLNVNIGNSGTCLRGVVFKPGHYCPVSAENDVAPHIHMINRNEINCGHFEDTAGIGNGQLLHNNGFFSESKTSKCIETPMESPQFSSLNGSFENRENSESVLNDKNGNQIISSQTLDVHLANGDDRHKPFDLETLPFMQSVNNNNNNNQFQEVPGPYNNSRMGPMSMLLQVVQEKMVKPGDSI